ncbi:MAG TPA: HlyD family efflux transporter periplasmic adaptor subunit [Candidatus Baltobacteraceae bacterium]|nr:HlyD family efflux transporter periplasmic adaptor subunit [Candidatus Baltobacteraceae bacterium]
MSTSVSRALPQVRNPAIALAIVLALAIAAALTFALRPQSAGGIAASGTIEVTQSDAAAKVQGRLVSLRVHDGQNVRRGQVLATLEQLNPSLNLAQARAQVQAAQAQVSSARAEYELARQTYGSQVTEAGAGVTVAQANVGQSGENLAIETESAALRVAQAQSAVSAAQSAFDRAGIELRRERSLVASGDEPVRSLDDAVVQYADAKAQLQSAHEGLGIARADARNVQIRQLGMQSARAQQAQSYAQLDAARAQSQTVQQREAQVLSAQAQLAQARAAAGVAEDQVRETRIVAPFDGAVVSHNVEVGDLVAPGTAVMTVADLTQPYMYVYVNETDLPYVKTGAHATVRIDGMSGRTFDGTVTEIATSGEFTPENVQTKEQRIEYLVFRVKIQFLDRSGTLKAGLPADAVIHA